MMPAIHQGQPHTAWDTGSDSALERHPYAYFIQLDSGSQSRWQRFGWLPPTPSFPPIPTSCQSTVHLLTTPSKGLASCRNESTSEWRSIRSYWTYRMYRTHRVLPLILHM